ncbi:ATP-binding protein [Antarcticimicrobium luteum]|uniref:ATP-binding protein n=1 Tax=Antarcticimicrobium luteum TaxID=2547397 RepID=A0A4R5V3Y6_9RHOB|nr:ATP-binding protein [Antarcticimicrobium luteum]TDK46235.1 ATP-binding protein [Antarcticimicrobium luteum]
MSQRSSHRFDATQLAARDGITAVMAQLRAQGLPDRAAGDVELALAEVVNNVVEHGYAGAPGGEVRVDADLTGARLELRVVDTGRPLPGGHLPPCRTVDLDRPPAELPEGGFGWGLIYSLTDTLRYDRKGVCNTLSMRFFLDGTGREKVRAGRCAPQTAP